MLEDLYECSPEYRALEPWELQTLLWSLGYTEELEDEEEIAVAVAMVKGGWTGEAA